MTVEELIDELEGHDPDLEIVFVYDYGDLGKTLVTETVAYVEESVVEYDEYFRTSRLLEEDAELEDRETQRKVVLLMGVKK